MAAPPTITDVVFDFCGVLIDWQCRAALDGHYPGELVDAIVAPDDPYGFFDYEDRMDGGMPLADILPVVQADHGKDIAEVFAYYIAHYGDALPRMVPGMETLLTDLRAAGTRIWGLTNWSSETFHFAFERFPVLQGLLEDTVVSGVERLHKPDAAIYALAQARFDLEPGRTLFFDDTVRNVEGARAVGWHALRFRDAAQARVDLETLHVLERNEERP